MAVGPVSGQGCLCFALFDPSEYPAKNESVVTPALGHRPDWLEVLGADIA